MCKIQLTFKSVRLRATSRFCNFLTNAILDTGIVNNTYINTHILYL